MKKIIFVIGVVFLAGAGVLYFHQLPSFLLRKILPTSGTENLIDLTLGRDYRDASYQINGQTMTLVNGVASTPASAPPVVTRYFGNEVRGDFNLDGYLDVAFLLTQSGGGSGTFYYVVAALAAADGYRGTNAVLLGDRIAPQTTEFRDGKIIVNYADRKPGEPMTAQPSVGVSKYLEVRGSRLQEVGQ